MNTCQTCHWWFQHGKFGLDPDFGHCVYHNGVKGTQVVQLKFKGLLETKHDFGCSCWKMDERHKPRPPEQIELPLEADWQGVERISLDWIRGQGLSIRARKALHRSGLTRLADITQESLIDQRNCGETTINEILAWKAQLLANPS